MDKEHNCPHCEYHKQRAARWRAEAYKQAGHDVIELPWVGLTDEEVSDLWCEVSNTDFVTADTHVFSQAIEAKLKEKNT